MYPYEVMFIASPDLGGEEAVDGLIERFGRLIVDEGGQVTGVDKWGKKRLAYEINGYTEGYYVVITFRAEAPVVDELNRVMRITDGVIRHLVVRLEREPAPRVDEADQATPEEPGEPVQEAAPEAAGEAEAEETPSGEADSAEEAVEA